MSDEEIVAAISDDTASSDEEGNSEEETDLCYESSETACVSLQHLSIIKLCRDYFHQSSQKQTAIRDFYQRN